MSDAVDKINELQKMVLEGKEVPAETMLAAIDALRSERGLAAKASVEKKAAVKAATEIDIMALFAPPPKQPQ